MAGMMTTYSYGAKKTEPKKKKIKAPKKPKPAYGTTTRKTGDNWIG